MSDQQNAEEFDVVIIGGGPGGEGAALYGTAAGLKIAMVEKDKVGGTCLHRGCIPAKRLLETASIYRAAGEAAKFGITTGELSVDMAAAVEAKQKVVDQLHAGLSGLLKRRKVEVFNGVGRLEANGTVTVTHPDGTTSTINAKNVVLAAGSVVRTIPGFEIDGKFIMTSDEVLELDRVPATAAVIGGGAIGCEFASMLSDLGANVTILEALDKIIPGCDADVVRALGKSFKKRGIDVRTGVRVNGHTPTASGLTTAVHLEGADDLEVEVVVVSVGRRPYSDGLVAEGSPVRVDERGFVEVDKICRTGVPGIFAIGDIIATPALAHVGYAEAKVVIQEILGEDPMPIDYGKVPWAIYCHPEIAFAGMTEAQAREAGLEIAVDKHRYMGNARALILAETDGMVKIIAEKDEDGKAGRILGVHMMGPWVTEQLGQGYLAVNWEATVEDVAAFIQPHPTLSELFGETALALTGRGMHG